eukprot:1499156-Pyramimonas_sp.AAC.1
MTRDLKNTITEERELHRGVVCACFEHADHGLGRPMRRPSRGPNFRETSRVWSRGDGAAPTQTQRHTTSI